MIHYDAIKPLNTSGGGGGGPHLNYAPFRYTNLTKCVKTAVRTLVTGPSVGRPSVPMPVGGTYGTYHPALMKTSEGAYLPPPCCT